MYDGEFYHRRPRINPFGAGKSTNTLGRADTEVFAGSNANTPYTKVEKPLGEIEAPFGSMNAYTGTYHDWTAMYNDYLLVVEAIDFPFGPNGPHV